MEKWMNMDRGREGVKNPEIFADVLNGSPLTAKTILYRICSLSPKPKHLQSARGSVRERERVPISPSPSMPLLIPKLLPSFGDQSRFFGAVESKEGTRHVTLGEAISFLPLA